MFPIIDEMRVQSSFKFLWLKYVTGTNLSNHCARCLTGEYSRFITTDRTRIANIILDEHEAKYYYLCGVAIPMKWGNNFHLAFKYSPHQWFEVSVNGIYIKIINAERIEILPDTMYESGHPKLSDRYFSTCRNWQFAHMIAGESNA